MQKPAVLFILLLLLCSRTFARPAGIADSLGCSQLVIVVTSTWDDVPATLYAYEKKQGRWVLQFSHPAVVGAKGLGIGDGLVSITVPGAPIKKEGDLKSPAGIFSIGAAFGYAPAGEAAFIKNRYIQARDTVICVDDARSVYYNRIIGADTAATRDWSSFENMHLTKDYYKWGLFVAHNSPNAIPGRGSCIFIHIWGTATEGTEGCTAMEEGNMVKLLHWIDAAKKPLLVQMPQANYAAIKNSYGLPALP